MEKNAWVFSLYMIRQELNDGVRRAALRPAVQGSWFKVQGFGRLERLAFAKPNRGNDLAGVEP
jgi:hypothetical protein